MEPPSAARDPTHRANVRNYFTHDEEMIACGSIISSPAVSRSDPGAAGPFTDSIITDRALIWDKMVAIFQGSDTWTYLTPDKNIVVEGWVTISYIIMILVQVTSTVWQMARKRSSKSALKLGRRETRPSRSMLICIRSKTTSLRV